MSAFNWVEFDDGCPVCGETTLIRAQCHLAASFEGDERGRFSGNTYRLGQELFWWDDNREGKPPWYEGGVPVSARVDTVRECCYASCVVRGHNLFAVVEFSNKRATRVIEIGPEEEWPATYRK